MASGVIKGTTANPLIEAKIEWESTLVEDYSIVTATLYLRRTNKGYTTRGTGRFELKIDNEVTSVDQYFVIEDEWVQIVSAFARGVNHNADGTKSIEIRASGSIPDTSLKSISCGATVALDPAKPVTNEASIDDITAEDGGELFVDKPFNIRYTAIPNYYYRLVIQASYSDGSNIVRTIDLGQKSGSDVYRVDLTPEECVLCYETYTYDAGTYIAVMLEGYTDNGYTTQAIYKYDSRWMYFTKANIKPTVSATYTPENSSLPSEFANIFIEGKSRVRADFVASGKYGTGINVSYTYLSVAGAQTTAYPTLPYIESSDPVKKSGIVPVSVTVMDFRNVEATTEDTINVQPYFAPSINSINGESSVICEREADSEGEPRLLRIKATKEYAYLMGTNTCRLSMSVIYGSSILSEHVLLDYSQGNEYNGIVSGVSLDPSLAYTIEFKVTDKLGGEGSLTVEIPKVTPTFVRGAGGNKASFGGYPEEENMLDVHWNQRVRGTLFLGGQRQPVADFVIEQGVSGIWIYRKWASGIAELWGSVTQTAKANTAWGDEYYTGYADKQTYPFAFLSRPYELVTLHPGVSGNLLMRLANTTTQTGNYACSKTGANTSNSDFIYDFYVIGKYK